MDNSTYVSLSLATALQRDLDITANNIANANTTGFKTERLLFESFLNPADSGADEGTSFVIDRGSYVDDAQGGVTRTDNPLDAALLGKGWFAYELTSGQTAYGRDGRFSLDPQGNLVTVDGHRVLDSGGAPIALPADASGAITIAPDGTIGSTSTGPVAQIGMFDLPDLQSYLRLGNGMFAPPAGAPAGQRPVPAAGTELVQGSIENSNVQPVVEVTRLMTIQQAYDRSVKLMSTEDELQRDMLRRLGQLG